MQKLPKQISSSLPSLCKDAIGLSKKFDAKTFMLQTTLDRKFLARGENFEDSPLQKCMAIKNIINSKAISHIEKNSNLKNSQKQADIALRLDFKNNTAKATPQNIFIFARYLKKSREYCQHEWACSACRGKGCKKCNFKKENYPSIETSIRNEFLPAFKASACKLHASGREDVDVMMLGSGRPCVIEVINPQIRDACLSKICSQIKEKYPLELLSPKKAGKFWISAVCNSHFDKHYSALASSPKPFAKDDFIFLKKHAPLTLRQRTPLRVVKRRSDIIRLRKIYSINLKKIEKGEMHLKIFAEAGTYIKEFIHGDGGRTNPSLSSMLARKCECKSLDVIKIEDFFLKTISQ